MDKLHTFIRQHWIACLVGAAVLCGYGYLTFRGSECFNCEQTEVYKSDQRRSSGSRFLHK